MLPVLIATASASLAGANSSLSPDSTPPPPSASTETAFSVAGYTDDEHCAACHRSIYDSYQDVAMARSFYRPRPENRVEDFTAGFFHEASSVHYEIEPSSDGLLFRQYQLDLEGQKTNLFEQPIDWILGSGNHARTYLYQTEHGELYQLPIAWYSSSSGWGMAPGFDRPDHLGVTRKITRECMFCHNAYPNTPMAADGRWEPHLFPKNLPEGTGCQRCHGPGAEHVKLALEVSSMEQVRTAIVNPAKLTADRRNDICFSCHLQPSVALPGIRRFGVGDYSFRAGQALSSYLLQVEIQEADQAPSERFEINHHPYRLMQSKCYRESDLELSCLTCHDPHRKVLPADRAAHYRAACLECHEADACGLDEMHAGTPGGVAPDDCVSCHMPKRRPQDVVNVVMTDHAIRKQTGGADFHAPRAEREPNITGVEFLNSEERPEGVLGEIYLASAVLRIARTSAATRHLAGAIQSEPQVEVTPYLDLVSAQLHLQQFEEASRTLEEVMRRQPQSPLAWSWLALSKSRQEPLNEAIVIAERAVELLATRPESRFNLGHFLLRSERNKEAAAHLEAAVNLRPNMAVAWLYLGHAFNRLGGSEQSAAAYRKALSIDSTLTRAYLSLGQVLLEQGDRQAASKVWRHGSWAARNPEEVRNALVELEAELSLPLENLRSGQTEPSPPD